MRPTTIAHALKLGVAVAAIAAAAPAAADTYGSTVIMSDLNNPRGLEFAPDGSLYVAEAGVPTTGGPTTVARGVTFHYSDNGSITRYSGGVQHRVVTGLPSLGAPTTNETIGPTDIAFGPGAMPYVLIGLGNDPNVRSTHLAADPDALNLGRVLHFNDGGGFGSFADVSAYEAMFNPLGGVVDSNPFHFVPNGTGLLVADAGSNTLLGVSPAGAVSLIAPFPGRPIGPPAPFSDSVPTSVAIGPDGNYYVAELTGFPFTPGAARIYQVTPGGLVSIHYSGSTMITDLAFGADGSLYAIEFDTNGLIQPGIGGALIRVGAGGARELLFDDLVNPTGLTIGSDGAFYVSNFGNSSGQGQVLRIAAIPEPATWALMIAGFGLIGGMLRRRRTAPLPV